MILLLFVFKTDILGFPAERVERFAAVDIELPEEFQILQTGIVDIGADQVDTDVKGVSDEKDHKEHNDVAGSAAMVLKTMPMTLPASMSAISRA